MAYLAEVGAPAFASLDVSDPDFFEALEPLLKSVSIADWNAYLRWTVVHGLVSSAPKAFVDEDFAFFDRRLRGQAEIQARWKRCVDATDEQLGEALGEAYVEREFSPEAKQRVLVMTRQIEKAMEAAIKTLDWMGDKTKARALEKLASVTIKIGYPDKWRNYSKLEIVRGDALGNMERASGFEIRRQLAKIGKAVDPGEWSTTPPTNNASYDPQRNEINIPAGILQPPNFAMKEDDAANYGNVGVVIGHELTHGFDDEGRHYDAHGNLQDWWTKKDAGAFEARACGFIDEYGRGRRREGLVRPGEGHTRGWQTDAWREHGRQWRHPTIIQRVSDRVRRRDGGQGFLRPHARSAFLPQLCAGLVRKQHRRVRQEFAKTDPHSPGKYRVNGALVNTPAFREAFGCKLGAPMAPAAVYRVW
jgi:putative endopeptidase